LTAISNLSPLARATTAPIGLRGIAQF
jgi:hypothetical protein